MIHRSHSLIWHNPWPKYAPEAASWVCAKCGKGPFRPGVIATHNPDPTSTDAPVIVSEVMVSDPLRKALVALNLPLNQAAYRIIPLEDISKAGIELFHPKHSCGGDHSQFSYKNLPSLKDALDKKNIVCKMDDPTYLDWYIIHDDPVDDDETHEDWWFYRGNWYFCAGWINIKFTDDHIWYQAHLLGTGCREFDNAQDAVEQVRAWHDALNAGEDVIIP